MVEKILIGGKVTEEEKRIIEKASELDRRTLSSFIAKASLDRAEELLKEDLE